MLGGTNKSFFQKVKCLNETDYTMLIILIRVQVLKWLLLTEQQINQRQSNSTVPIIDDIMTLNSLQLFCFFLTQQHSVLSHPFLSNIKKYLTFQTHKYCKCQ